MKNYLLAQRFDCSCFVCMAEFQVEVIFKSIKELQNERLENEKLLAEEIAKRKEIESTLDAVTLRYSVVSEKHAKISETVRLAEQKVAHAQSCVMKYEQLNQEKREKISELSTDIKREDAKRSSQLAEFEQQLKELADKFRDAKRFYADQSLENHISMCEEQKRVKHSEVETQQSEAQELLSKIERLKAAQDTCVTEAVSEEMWQIVIDQLMEENKAAKRAYELSKEQLLSTQNEQRKLEMQLQEDQAPHPSEE
ncbi:hypothetical protein EMCRGX_G034142 [Ephydatia muelleri]